MSVRIVIRANGAFDEAHALSSDLVFWTNEDTQPHAPFGLNVEPDERSSGMQPDPTAQPIVQPRQLDYTCTIHGEPGVLFLYNDFKVKSPVAITATTPVPVVTGGRAPYTMSASDVAIVPASEGFSLDLAETTSGTNAGISAVLNNAPTTPFTVTFNISAKDSLDNELDRQPVTISFT
jgi:hypothetical protein